MRRRKVSQLVYIAAALLGAAILTNAQAEDAYSRLQIPLATRSDAGPAMATLIETGQGTRLIVSLGRTPEGLSNPNIIAEVREGRCVGPIGPAVFRTVTKVDDPSPSTGGSAVALDHNLGGTVGMPLSALRAQPYAIALETGPEAQNQVIACGNIG